MKHTDVDTYFSELTQWKEELNLLRAIVMDCELEETYKWRGPCYTYKNTNILILGGFKEYCVVSFMKGVLLRDTEKILVSPGENSQSVKFAKFTSKEQIIAATTTIKNYIYESIEVEKEGIKVDLTASKEFELVAELKDRMAKDNDFRIAFQALTTGRQRAYNMHFGQAKQATTRIARIENYAERILGGKGMNDCVCGHSKRMPNCDGSHKYL